MPARNQHVVGVVVLLFGICVFFGAGVVLTITASSPIGAAIALAACAGFGYAITRLARTSRARE